MLARVEEQGTQRCPDRSLCSRGCGSVRDDEQPQHDSDGQHSHRQQEEEDEIAGEEAADEGRAHAGDGRRHAAQSAQLSALFSRYALGKGWIECGADRTCCDLRDDPAREDVRYRRRDRDQAGRKSLHAETEDEERAPPSPAESCRIAEHAEDRAEDEVEECSDPDDQTQSRLLPLGLDELHLVREAEQRRHEEHEEEAEVRQGVDGDEAGAHAGRFVALGRPGDYRIAAERSRGFALRRLDVRVGERRDVDKGVARRVGPPGPAFVFGHGSFPSTARQWTDREKRTMHIGARQ